MLPEILETLFIPFMTSRTQGTGLGLAVASQIVKEHGGSIQVRTDEEWSTVFTIILPVRHNADRRQMGADRRARHDDRRGAIPAEDERRTTTGGAR